MPTKIRLQRHGKKRYAFFHVVIADGRAPRDGKFIEKIGTYNPNTNPATIDINFDRALKWVKDGAQPTDTVRALLSYNGVMHKNHLDKGVLKGALTQEQADAKFEEWLTAKEGKINSKKDKISADAEEEAAKKLAAEKEANKKKAESIAAKNAELAGEEEAAAEENATEEVSEETASTEEVKAEAPTEAATEEKAEEKKEEPKEEKAAE